MKINLPDITIQESWTVPGQVRKIMEEAGEVAEAIAENNPVETIREALDTMQTCATLILMVQKEWDMDLERLIREHEAKLVKKGYL